MGLIEQNLFGTVDKVAIAVARIRDVCEGKKVLCAFSGGKDSQACYYLCKRAGIAFDAQYSVTRFEPPELWHFVHDQYPDVIIRRHYRRSLVEEIKSRGLPSRFARWCCEAKHARTKGYDVVVVGVRAAESAKRRDNWRMMGYKPSGEFYVCPIIDWTTEDVWEWLTQVGAPHCSLYDEGFPRIGCACCPLAVRSLAKQVARWPKTAAMLRYGASLYVERLRVQNWKHQSGNPCGNWCKAPDPLAEYWRRWVTTGQTAHPIEEARTDEAPCLFEGSGFSEADSGLGLDED